MSSADPTAPEAGVMPGDAQPTTEIVRRTEQHVQVMPLMSDEEIRRYWRLAQSLAASRMFKDVAQAEQAFGKILLGRDLGLSPTQALTGIHLVEGKPEIAATTLASFVRRRPDTRYQVVEQTNEACELHFFHVYDPNGDLQALVHSEVCGAGGLELTNPGVPVEGCTCRPSHLHEGEDFLGSSRFDNEDVKLAQLDKPTKSGHPSNHVKYPRNMKFARAMSNGIKWFCPEATGGIPVYHEGELGEQRQLEAPRQVERAELPAVLVELIGRAQAVDSMAWRRNEVIARLPHPAANEYQPTVDGIAAEIQRWLAEHEVPEAEVVSDERSVEDVEAAEAAESADPAEQPAEAAAEPEAPAEEPEGINARYQADAEFRTRVDVLLSRQADLEAMLDDCADDDDSRRWEESKAELDQVQEELDALEVPKGWYPESTQQTSFGV